MPILLNDIEREALRGLISIAREAYIFGIRPFMDYATGIVGIHRGISYQSISEEIYVDSHQGIKAWRPTEKQLRHAVEWLEKRGLIERQKDTNKRDRRLVFRLPLATTDKSVQKKVGSKWADKEGSQKLNNDAELDNKVGNTESSKVGIPPESVISNTPHTRARAKKPISDTWKPSGRCYELIDKAEIPKSFADQCIDEFVLYWSESQERRASWDATFLNRVKTEWARANKNPARDATSTPGRAQPNHDRRGRTHEQHSRPLSRGERNARQFADQLKALEQAIAEEAQEDLDRSTMDQAPCDLRGEVVRFLPKRNSGCS